MWPGPSMTIRAKRQPHKGGSQGGSQKYQEWLCGATSRSPEPHRGAGLEPSTRSLGACAAEYSSLKGAETRRAPLTSPASSIKQTSSRRRLRSKSSVQHTNGPPRARSSMTRRACLAGGPPMARPGLEPGTPRFSVVCLVLTFPGFAGGYVSSLPSHARSGLRAFCVRFPSVTADGGIIGLFADALGRWDAAPTATRSRSPRPHSCGASGPRGARCSATTCAPTRSTRPRSRAATRGPGGARGAAELDRRLAGLAEEPRDYCATRSELAWN